MNLFQKAATATSLALLATTLPTLAQAHDYLAIDQIIDPLWQGYAAYFPVFDFDTDGCLPSAAISREGAQNGGLATSGSITGGCRNANFLTYSNTYYRTASASLNGVLYSAHLFELYFLKDQATVFGGGHRHDIESVIVYFKGSTPTHVLVSAHGKWLGKTYAEVAKDNLHPKVVYHKDGLLTHAFRHASSSEAPENPYGRWVLPKVLSWNHAYVANTLPNATYRSKINTLSFGDASFKQKDGIFASKVNEAKPAGYPTF